MFSTCAFAMMALLAICTFDSARPAAISAKYETSPSRNKSRKYFDAKIWAKWEQKLDGALVQNMIKKEFDHYQSLFKLIKHKPEDWIDSFDHNVRVISNVEGLKKKHLKVVVKKNVIQMSGYNAKGLWTNILKKSVALPPNADVSKITATLTSDGYLVIDIPIDKTAPKSSGERKVPIVESGKPIDSKPPDMEKFSFLYSDSSSDSEQDNSSD